MSKDKLELDFSDISSQPAPNLGVKPIVRAVQQAEPVQDKPLGISVAIELEKGKYLFKDLADCSGEEFLQFAFRVYPMMDKKTNPRDFDTRSSKSNAFQQILRFHSSNFLASKREDKVGPQ